MNNEHKVLPLKEAYRFGNERGLERQMADIKDMEIGWGLTTTGVSLMPRLHLEVPLKLLFALSSGGTFPPAHVGFRSEAGAKLNFGLKSGHQLHRAQALLCGHLLAETISHSVSKCYAATYSFWFGVRYSLADGLRSGSILAQEIQCSSVLIQDNRRL